MRTSAFYILLLIFIFSCAGNSTSQLIGKWTALGIVQADRSLEVDLSLIQFNFDQQGNYRFTSTLDYVEEGTFSVEGDKLITQDSINGNTSKSVIIEQLSSDTLKLRMKNESEWMVLTMLKE